MSTRTSDDDEAGPGPRDGTPYADEGERGRTGDGPEPESATETTDATGSVGSASETAEDRPSPGGEGGAARAPSPGPASGPPPPWQRGGSRPPTGPLPVGGVGGPNPGPGAPAGGPPAPGSPGRGTQAPGTPAAGMPRAGGGPGPAGTNGPGTNGPGPGGPGGGRPASPPSGPLPTQSGGSSGGGDRRASTALIDAPTNQLSPEQLAGLRGSRQEPEPDLDDLDDEPPTARPARGGKVPRRASLQLKRFDPWSVLKLALVLGVALFFVWMFAVGVLYAVLDGMGVWAQLNGTYSDLTSDTGGAGSQLITAGGVFGVAAVVGVVNTILFTALASVSAFIYNISADVAGGIEVTLSERD